jgi:uncharacterized protein YbjT (DUF2867 family)
MKVILFGASGMVGQGVLRECLLDPEITQVLSVCRTAGEQRNAKLEEIVHKDFTDYSAIEGRMAGYQACFFCLGVSSAGMNEKVYTRLTYDYALAAALVLVKLNPQLTFLYISGQGTDSSECGRTMWARVKGKTENDLLKLGFKSAYMLRPGFIQPLHGIKSRTKFYNILYLLLGPLFPIFKTFFPRQVTTTRELAQRMITIAKQGAPKSVLENSDLHAIRVAS